MDTLLGKFLNHALRPLRVFLRFLKFYHKFVVSSELRFYCDTRKLNFEICLSMTYYKIF